jgi:molybdenum cofactor biosynthesis enzyme
MQDLTDAAPIRRMSVARANLAVVADERLRGRAEAAAIAAVHAAPRTLPGSPGFQPTHVDVLFADDAITVTVQAFARAPLAAAAMLAATVAALVVAGDAPLDVRLVQNVP